VNGAVAGLIRHTCLRLISAQVPAVMLVDGFMEPPRLEGATVILPSEMQLKVAHCSFLRAP
jgi:hypothetical protein